MLFLVATPIGNLADISLRALEILKTCDYILCEDTRHSRILLQHYDIKTHLKSFHKFNEASQENQILQDLQENKNIALISDAGTPGISDPGFRLVEKCCANNVVISPIPGACAAICALICSGLNSSLFQFVGFLPQQQSLSNKCIQQAMQYPGTSIFYEAPQRVKNLLSQLHHIDPQRKVVLCRELTKKFESFYRGTVDEILKEIENKNLKGECIVVVAGCPNEPNEGWQELTPQEHVGHIMSTYNVSKKEAIKMVAEMRHQPKKNIYKECHKESLSDETSTLGS